MKLPLKTVTSRIDQRRDCLPWDSRFISLRGIVTMRIVRDVAFAAILCMSFAGLCSAATAGATPKAIFVILDGIPADVIERVSTPTIDAIASQGGYTRAVTGGPVGQPGETPTVSAPGYMSLVTGTWANKHNVYDNYDLSPNYDYWNLFRLVKHERPALRIGIFSTWIDNRTVLLGEGKSEAGGFLFDHVIDGLELDTARFPTQPMDRQIALVDWAIADEGAAVIAQEAPDLSWFYLQYTDDIGHEYGDGPEFDQAVMDMDARLEKIWAAVSARQQAYNEDWLVVVTTDHGRDGETGREHEGHTERERTIWIACNSQRLSSRFKDIPEIVDIYPSIARHMGITIPEAIASQLDGRSFID